MKTSKGLAALSVAEENKGLGGGGGGGNNLEVRGLANFRSGGGANFRSGGGLILEVGGANFRSGGDNLEVGGLI